MGDTRYSLLVSRWVPVATLVAYSAMPAASHMLLLLQVHPLSCVHQCGAEDGAVFLLRSEAPPELQPPELVPECAHDPVAERAEALWLALLAGHGAPPPLSKVPLCMAAFSTSACCVALWIGAFDGAVP